MSITLAHNTEHVVLGPEAGATVGVYPVEGGWRWRWRAHGRGMPVEAVGGRETCPTPEAAMARGVSDVRTFALRAGLR